MEIYREEERIAVRLALPGAAGMTDALLGAETIEEEELAEKLLKEFLFLNKNR